MRWAKIWNERALTPDQKPFKASDFLSFAAPYSKIVAKHHWIDPIPFPLERGGTLSQLEITYHTYGQYPPEGDVIWVCHALTANSDCADWWQGLVGTGKRFDPARDFIICANILGSCYGSSGPLSTNPDTGKPYFDTFPDVTMRDMVVAHERLRVHLGIASIDLAMGGSMGGYQVMEWAYQRPEVIRNLALLVTSARESAWGIAVHTTQRLAIETDPTWREHRTDAGRQGLITARTIGMLTYRNYATFVRTQTDNDAKFDDFRASSYLIHQGNKLADRFLAFSYWLLTRSMDSHHLGRDRGSVEDILKQIPQPAVVIGIASDILCPKAEQKALAQHLPKGQYVEIDSPFGHDGFLIESEQIAEVLDEFLG